MLGSVRSSPTRMRRCAGRSCSGAPTTGIAGERRARSRISTTAAQECCGRSRSSGERGPRGDDARPRRPRARRSRASAGAARPCALDGPLRLERASALLIGSDRDSSRRLSARVSTEDLADELHQSRPRERRERDERDHVGLAGDDDRGSPDARRGHGDERWGTAWDEGATALLRRRDPDGLWTQVLYGHTDRILGPAHGFVGNVLALGQRLGTRERTVLFERSNEVLVRFAVVEDGLANWAPAEGESLVHRRTGQIRVQWCHGAPGIVASAAAIPRRGASSSRARS